MSGSLVFLVAFAASAVEAVEAATVVLAMAITRGSRSALMGAAGGLAALCAAMAVLSPILDVIPLSPLRMAVGVSSLIVGGNWLRKAILRAAGRKAMHDEAAIFRSETQAGSRSRIGSSLIDRLGFVVAAKAVLLEGVEVVVIVLAIGAGHGHMGIAVLGALVAVVLVGLAAAALRKPLTRVPENTLKLGVGVILLSFGTFWAFEGAGLDWPAGDISILALVGFYAAAAGIAVTALRSTPSPGTRQPEVHTDW